MKKHVKCEYATTGDLKMKLKKFFSFFFYFFFIFRKPIRPVFTPSANSIAVIMPASIGDLTVFCDAAKKIAAGGKRITLICRKGRGTAELARMTGLFDRVIEINLAGFDRIRGMRSLNNIEADTAVCVPLGRHALSDACVFSVRANRRILPDTLLECTLPVIKKLSDKRADLLIPLREESERDRYTEFFSKSGLLSNHIEVFRFEQSQNIRSRTLAIFPGAGGGNGKRWKAERFAFVAGELVQKGLITKTVILGNDSDKDCCDRVYNLLNKSSNAVNLCGKTPILELLNMLTECCLTLSNDSGGAHLSIACDTPTVVICGMWQYGRFYPNSRLDQKHCAVFAEGFGQSCNSSFPRCDSECAACVEAVRCEDVLKCAEKILREYSEQC